jgi:hypothetical protein
MAGLLFSQRDCEGLPTKIWSDATFSDRTDLRWIHNSAGNTMILIAITKVASLGSSS